MHAFITGATGFIGKHVVKHLLAQNWHVTALCTNTKHTTQFPLDNINWCKGDIRSIETLRAAMPNNLDAVFHLAADTSTWGVHHHRQYQTNVIGTQNIAQVALEKSAVRFIHTSSVAVYGFHDTVIDEHSEMRGIDSPIGYYRSKFLAEEIIREHIKKGLDAVILNPNEVIGPYDHKNWGCLFTSISKGQLPAIPPGSKSFCDVDDVAKAHIQAFVHGRCGENYLLSGPNAELIEICRWISKRLGKTDVHYTLPSWVFKTLGALSSLTSYITRKEPAFNSDQAQIVCAKTHSSHEKAQRELQYRNSKSLDDMLDTTYQWWQQQENGQHNIQPSFPNSKQNMKRDLDAA